MDVNSITQVVGSLGFPIVACGALFYQNYMQNKQHKEETKGFTEAIQGNTLAIQKLTTLFESFVNKGIRGEHDREED